MPVNCPAPPHLLPSACGKVENIPLQAERHYGHTQKLFAFPPESVFAFRPECCSDSQRNAVRLQTGIAFAFDRIPHLSFGIYCAPLCAPAGHENAVTFVLPLV